MCIKTRQAYANTKNITQFSDKDGKIKYLEKVIDCVSMALGESLTAKPSKIVSGQEPQKTNEFLQALAKLLEKKIGTLIFCKAPGKLRLEGNMISLFTDTAPYVAKVLKGEKPGKQAPNNNKAGPTNAKLTAANNAKNKQKEATPTTKVGT